MRRCFSLLLILFSWVFAGLRVEKVLESAGVKEYNHWVKVNREKYPELKPVYITAQIEGEDEKGFRLWEICYYDEDGNVIKREIERASWVRVSSDYDEVYITKVDHPMYPQHPEVVVKDRFGNRLFSVKDVRSVMETETGFYITSWLQPSSPGDTFPIVNRKGEIIGRLPILGYPSYPVVSCRRYAVLEIGSEVEKGEYLVVLDERAREWWRKRFDSQFECTISEDGSRIAVGDNGKVYVYDEKGRLMHIYKMPAPYDYFNPGVAFSPTGRYLVACAESSKVSRLGDWSKRNFGSTCVCLYDNTTGKTLWKILLPQGYPAYRKGILKIMGDGDYVIIGFSNALIYVIDREGNISQIIDLSPEQKDVPVYDKLEGRIRKIKEPRMGRRWRVRFVDNLLVVEDIDEKTRGINWWEIYEIKIKGEE